MTRRALLYLTVITGAGLTTFPFLWMVATSLKDAAESASPTLDLWPDRWMWSNYIETFRAAPFGRYFFNSFLVAFSVTAAVVLTSLPAGYAFARLRFRGKNMLFVLVLATMMVPFETTLIPNFVLVHRLGWYNSYAALIVPWCANAFSVFLMRQAFLGLPGDFLDAARVDGCGPLRFLVWVGAPLVKPMLVTVGLFAFLGSYNALLWPLVVTGTNAMRVVQVGLTVFSGAEGVRFDLLMCAATIIIAPTVVLYLSAQRHFIESSVGAGIKG